MTGSSLALYNIHADVRHTIFDKNMINPSAQTQVYVVHLCLLSYAEHILLNIDNNTINNNYCYDILSRTIYVFIYIYTLKNK